MDYSILINSLINNINATTVLTIMGTVVTATIGIFLAVWGGRKIINGIQNAVDGRLAFNLDISREKYRQAHFNKYGYIPTDSFIDKTYLNR